MTFAQLLAMVVDLLDRASIPYMVTGSLASSFFGEPRSTRDVDVVIDPKADGLRRLVDDLRAAGFYVDREAALQALDFRSQFNAIASDGSKIDFIVRRDRPFSIEEFGRRQPATLLGTSAFVASAEDVIVAKLEWAAASGSDRQLADVAGIVSVADQLDVAYIERWVGALGLEEAWRTLRPEAR